MQLRVDLLPKENYRDVVVVIDVLGTGTLAPLLFSRGLDSLFISPGIRAARRLAEERGLLQLGERDGLPPEGFNYGASPAELARADVSGRSAVLLSGNGPRALSVTNGARHVLLGSFYNADALIAQAAALAETEVALVCTGLDGDEDLDDTLCAGYLAAQLRRRLPGAQLGGGALFALSLLRAFPSPVSALWQSRSGHHLRRLDLTGDLAVGSLVSQTDAVPRLTERGEDLYLFTAAPPAD